jgi:nitric oxide reductase subunit B
MEVQEQLALFYWMRLGSGIFVVISVFMFVYAMFGPAREQAPARTRTTVAPAE